MVSSSKEILYTMDEDEALKQYCKRRISLIRSREQHTESPEQGRSKYKNKGASGSNNAGHRRQGVVKDQFIDLRRCERDSDQTSLGLKPRKAPEDKPVPVQLIYMLKFKTLNESIRRAANEELHDPTTCSACQKELAFLALKGFIGRKKTHLKFQTLKGRLNTCLCFGDCDVGGVCPKCLKAIQRYPSLDLGGSTSKTCVGHSNL